MSFDFLALLKSDMDKQKDLLAICQRLIKGLPEAAVTSTNKGGKTYYYYKRPEDPSFQIVRKGHPEDQTLYLDICLHKFLALMIQNFSHNLMFQELLSKEYKSYEIEEVWKDLPEACKVLPANHVRNAIRKSDPLPYPSQSECPYRTHELVHRTSFGLYVRSKSEVLIAEALWAAGVNFAYEPEIKLLGADGKERTFYPDFLVWANSGQVYYWEHAGLFGNPEYRSRNTEKMYFYFLNGITIGSNLILTCDTKEGALDPDAISRYIKWFQIG